MSNTRTLRKSVISIAMGLCLSSLAIEPGARAERHVAPSRVAPTPATRSRSSTARRARAARSRSAGMAATASASCRRATTQLTAGDGRAGLAQRVVGRHDHGQPGQWWRGQPGCGAGGRVARRQSGRCAFDRVGHQHHPRGPRAVAGGPEPRVGRAAGARRDLVGVHLRRAQLRRFVRGGERRLHQWPGRDRSLSPARVLDGAVCLLRGVPGQDRRLFGGIRPQHRWRHQCGDALRRQRIPWRRAK